MATTNYPSEWVDIYKKNGYQHIDPVVQSALQRVSPFAWDESQPINSSANSSEVFNRSKNYNVVNGYTFVLHDHNQNMATLTLMKNDKKSVDVEREMHNKKDNLQMLLVTVHEKLTALHQTLASNKYHCLQEKKNLLSTRENEVLYWASMGKTYLEVAIILDLKISTVKFHIGNIVRKMGVTNARHAIRLAAEMRLIKPV